MNTNEIINNIRTEIKISADQSFFYAQVCSSLLQENDTSDQGRQLLINVLDRWEKFPQNHYPMWVDLLESAGFYPYIAQDSSKKNSLSGTSSLIRKEYHSSENIKNIYFHQEQKEIMNLINKGKNVIVSAPTSFGKSLLIEEIVASKKYKNILIIQPTLALLDETRKKLKKYTDSYKIIVKTSQQFSEKTGNLFLLTAERVMEYPNLPKIDFFVIDEFYKLSTNRDDERSDVLNNAFHLLLNQKAQFYLSGPNIENISKGFSEKYNAVFLKSQYSLVDTMTINYYELYKDKFGDTGRKQIVKQEALFNLLFSLLDEQTIIYCSSPSRARELSLKFCSYLTKRGVNMKPTLSLNEWISENISDKWSILNCLKFGIGVHDGALPKHINSSIINYFNEQKLNFLFCTSTIIEGVNTSAKNIIFFDKTKGKRSKIDYFDYSNIRGRAGRMMVHFVGKIYNFNPPPPRESITVDIPFYEQNPINDEILIHLENEEIKIDKTSEQYKRISSLPFEEKHLFKKNGLLVAGQMNVLQTFRENMNSNLHLILWKRMPNYQQLQYIINLAYENFLKKGETTVPVKQLLYLTFNYGREQNINSIIQNRVEYLKNLPKNKTLSEEKLLDDSILYAFQFLRHWFSYKVPKWLLTMNNLQKFVAEEKGLIPGDYTFYASQLENDFIPSYLSILSEYGIPKSAVIKLQSKIPLNISEDQLLKIIKKHDFLNTIKDLSKYEKEKFEENF
ncbi:MAG TPA: DEAD/DEAH box helicase [Candidatus Saccharimonadales bacterium]|nr:DEAD/DEAH box helicase [Candidatus Saccharimonadales bacterium]